MVLSRTDIKQNWQNIAKALSIAVENGIFGSEKAMEVAEMLLYLNPLKIFGLKANK